MEVIRDTKIVLQLLEAEAYLLMKDMEDSYDPVVDSVEVLRLKRGITEALKALDLPIHL